jgi:chromate reductase
MEEGGMTDSVRILGIAGSLRKGSYNRSALQAAANLVPQDSSLDIFDLD